MSGYDFTLVLNREPTEPELDSLFEAGCDDSTPEGEYLHFDRLADTLAAAITSAVRNVESVPGLEVVGVGQDDLVTLRDVAARTGRTYESVRLIAAGRRGPGGFPRARHTTSGDKEWSLYSWTAVATWLLEALGEPVAVPAREIAIADQALALRRLLRDESERDRQMITGLLAA